MTDNDKTIEELKAGLEAAYDAYDAAEAAADATKKAEAAYHKALEEQENSK